MRKAAHGPIPDPVFTQAMELRAWGVYGDAYPSALVAGSALNSNHPMVYVYHPDSLAVSGGVLPWENLLTGKTYSDALIGFDLTANIIVCGVPLPWRLFPQPVLQRGLDYFLWTANARSNSGRLRAFGLGKPPVGRPWPCLPKTLPSGLYCVTMDDPFHPTQPWVVQH